MLVNDRSCICGLHTPSIRELKFRIPGAPGEGLRMHWSASDVNGSSMMRDILRRWTINGASRDLHRTHFSSLHCYWDGNVLLDMLLNYVQGDAKLRSFAIHHGRLFQY
jgi:hypothetical protein